ncbi:MAG: flagellar biosynthesis protein FlhF [bacterium]
MNLKRYRVNNIQEALQMIKRDLGPDAVIVSTRQVKEGRGTFGLFGKTMLEVTAAKDDRKAGGDVLTKTKAPATYKPPVAGGGLPETPASGGAAPATPSAGIDPQKALIPLRQEIQSLRELVQEMSTKNSAYEDYSVTQLKHELGEMRHMLHLMASRNTVQEDLNLSENLMVIYQQMKFGGMEEKFARRLVLEAQKNITEEDLQNFSYVKIFVARMLMKVLKTSRGIESISGNQKIVALIGPTGVGKTTTAAKIASEQMLRYKRKVALITIDTFRIAAVEQLRTYAKIINVPLSTVSSKEEMDKAIESYSDYEVVIIDTGGCSQRDEGQMFELRNIFDERGRIHNLLVLSATTKDNDLNEITRRFGSMPIEGVVFTKLDESSGYGSLFNHVIRFKKPISFLTTGQKVPEDIEMATKERLVDLLLNISGS